MPEEHDKWDSALSRALQAREASLKGDRTGLDALMDRLQREGLLRRGTERVDSRWMPFAMAASVVTISVLVGILMFQREEPVTPADPVRYRGFGTELTVPVSSPERWVAETERALTRAGCAVQRVEGEVLIITVDAAPQCIRPLNHRLVGTGIQITEAGRYRLLVTPAS